MQRARSMLNQYQFKEGFLIMIHAMIWGFGVTAGVLSALAAFTVIGGLLGLLVNVAQQKAS